MSTPSNGWRSGRDPVQRWLRILTAITCLAVFVWLTVDPERTYDDLPAIAIAMGALLLLLGYEGVIRVPYIGRSGGQSKDEERDDR